MSIPPKAPPVYKPTPLKLAAPPLYRVQQSTPVRVQLKRPTSSTFDKHPAPPVYRVPADNSVIPTVMPKPNAGNCHAGTQSLCRPEQSQRTSGWQPSFAKIGAPGALVAARASSLGVLDQRWLRLQSNLQHRIVQRAQSPQEFNQDAMLAEFRKSQRAMQVEKEANTLGAHLVSYDSPKSNANTNLDTLGIQIKPTLTNYEAALSYIWELTNVKNAARINKVRNNPDRPSLNADPDTIQRFIMEIISIEAESALNRAYLTIENGWEELELHNNPQRKRYIDIAKEDTTDQVKIEKMAAHMYKEGKQGKTGSLIREVYKKFLKPN